MTKKTETKPWYKDGLRFTCTQCGNCCTGSPGYVWFTKQEGQQIAESLEMAVDDFHDVYARKIGIRHSLKEFPNGDCVFFDGEKRTCNIYSVRPRQCRTWPFWDSNLRSEKEWAKTCEECPGSGKGKLYQLEQIETQRKVVKI